jgi:hypothetical protein
MIYFFIPTPFEEKQRKMKRKRMCKISVTEEVLQNIRPTTWRLNKRRRILNNCSLMVTFVPPNHEAAFHAIMIPITEKNQITFDVDYCLQPKNDDYQRKWECRFYLDTAANKDFHITEKLRNFSLLGTPINEQGGRERYTELLTQEHDSMVGHSPAAYNRECDDFIPEIRSRKKIVIGSALRNIQCTAGLGRDFISSDERFFVLEIKNMESFFLMKEMITMYLHQDIFRRIFFLWLAESFENGCFSCCSKFTVFNKYNASVLWGRQVLENMKQLAVQ